jgi:hypothetical protein
MQRLEFNENTRGSALLEALLAITIIALISAFNNQIDNWHRIHLPEMNRNLEEPTECRGYINRFQAFVNDCGNTGPQL